MNKAYTRINFQNTPSTATPLNATNMNKIDKAINDIDNRVIELAGYQEEAQEAAEMASSSASAASRAAATAAADAEARVNEVIQGLEVYTKEDSHKKFASVIKQVATGSPILIKDSSDAGVIDFKGKGRSTQNGTPTPDSLIAIDSVADSGYFDGELLQGYYNESGTFSSNSSYVCSKNLISCNGGDKVKIVYAGKIGSITFNFYDKDMNVLSRPSNTSEVTEYEAIAPTNAKYVHFMFREVTGTIAPQTAKHITVTINDKYALIVKSVGKNLLDISKIPNTANMTNNQNGTLTITNSYSNNTYKKLSELTDLKIGQTYTLSFSSTSEHQFIYLSTTSEKWENGMSLKMTQNRLDSAVYFYGNTSGVTTISNIQIEENTVPTDYEPYKETVTYIPLNEPLRSVGEVKDEIACVDGEYRIIRRVGETQLTSFEKNNTSPTNYLYYQRVSNVKLSSKVLANNLIYKEVNAINVGNTESGVGVSAGINSQVIYVNVGYYLTENTVEAMNTWLQANPITIVYELVEPVVETIEPVDIVTYDNVTYLTASDNAEMEVTYATDTKSYIDSKFAELHAAIVNML